MHAVLTLTADPATRPLRADHVESAAAVLRSVGAEPGAPVVLAEGAAVDLPFDGAVPDAIAAALRAALSGLPADVNPQGAAGRRKRLLIADMDSTMITSESLDDLAEYAGIRDRVAPITARAMRGEIGFVDALRERVAMMAGQPAALLDRLLAERIELTAGAAALVATMRGGGAYAALVSGGFTFATGHVRRLVGFDEDRSNTLLLERDRIAGRVGEEIDSLLLDLQPVGLAQVLADLGLELERGFEDVHVSLLASRRVTARPWGRARAWARDPAPSRPVLDVPQAFRASSRRRGPA